MESKNNNFIQVGGHPDKIGVSEEHPGQIIKQTH